MSGIEPLRQRANRLYQLCDLLTKRLGDEAWSGCPESLAGVIGRLERGVDHTLVALVGGSGSGKSSLFNALAKMEFAQVGALRPTTTKANACVWGPGAAPLLEWAGVNPDDTIQRDSVLEPELGEWGGMILVDLPDSDSADVEHHKVAQRILPLADILIWVTDPQKYADPGLRELFLPSALEQVSRVNLVVLNQVDQLSQADAAPVSEALTSLLESGGWANPKLLVTSTVTGEGIEDLRSVLVERTAEETVAARRVAGDLAREAGEVLAQAPLAEYLGADQMAAYGQGLAAAGKTVAEALEALALDGSPEPFSPGLVEVTAAEVRPLVKGYIGAATAVLPEPWQDVAALATASAANLATRLNESLADLSQPAKPGWLSRLFGGAGAREKWRAAWLVKVKGSVVTVVEKALSDPVNYALSDLKDVAAELRSLASSPGGLGGAETGQAPDQGSAEVTG
ncbi:MAG: 50S ribosome-binding GTPase [Micrococcales bacterium]|nr:50S ribosome-binding GTPase [Micrococcales bacterium]